MPQYMLSVHYAGDGTPPYADDEEMQRAFRQTEEFNNELQASGQWVFGGGLHDPEIATVVRTEGGDVVMTDGPFAETKEQLGGFWVVNADDLDAALALATRASIACMGPVEVRPFQDG
jgi:hypothetical protein